MGLSTERYPLASSGEVSFFFHTGNFPEIKDLIDLMSVKKEKKKKIISRSIDFIEKYFILCLKKDFFVRHFARCGF